MMDKVMFDSLLPEIPASPPPLSHVSSLRPQSSPPWAPPGPLPPLPPQARPGKAGGGGGGGGGGGRPQYRGEVEQLCISLLCQYQHSLASLPPSPPR